MIIARRNESVVEVRNRINGAFVRGPIVVGVLLECHVDIMPRFATIYNPNPHICG